MQINEDVFKAIRRDSVQVVRVASARPYLRIKGVIRSKCKVSSDHQYMDLHFVMDGIHGRVVLQSDTRIFMRGAPKPFEARLAKKLYKLARNNLDKMSPHPLVLRNYTRHSFSETIVLEYLRAECAMRGIDPEHVTFSNNVCTLWHPKKVTGIVHLTR